MARARERWIVRGGHVFDGCGGEGELADVLVEGGKVRSIHPPGRLETGTATTVDAKGCWVTPGFVDLHTHYDAEVEIASELGESLRHGVTTVVLGSCGLGMAVGEPSDLADMFCRVEGIPRSTVAPLLERIKDWSGPAEYLDHLRGLPLGPNVACMLGHSTIRAAAMGLGPSVTEGREASASELRRMEALLEEALDAGYIGLSVNTLPWDKLDGDTYRSRPTPSVHASWSEYQRLTRILRERDKVFQGVPNLVTKANVLRFVLESAGVGRPPLRTTFIALIDAKSSRLAAKAVAGVARAANSLLGADVRIQALPCPFDIWSDGMEVPVLEEIGAGTEALHLNDPDARAALLRQPSYRRRFRRQWRNALLGKAFHRDLNDTYIVDAPDPQLVGKSFAAVGAERGIDAIDAFLDTMAEHGDAIRWYSVIGNDRPEVLRWILRRPDILVGFSDAGAHLRNMAFYNFPLRMLRQVLLAEREGRPFMSVGRAVERLTREIAEWMGIDAGTLRPGRRADLVVIDPEGLDDSVDALTEEEMPAFDGLRRLVRRNDRAVRAVFVAGRFVFGDGTFAEPVGKEKGFGRVLTAGDTPPKRERSSPARVTRASSIR